MNLAPIVLFVYNRPNHAKQTINALQQNNLAALSDLIIYSDAAQNELSSAKVLETRAYIKTISGFNSIKIIEREQNVGLAANVIEGVTDVVNNYGTAIILEDDLVVSPFFLQYMNDALIIYKNDEKVISIHGYVYPVKEKLPQTFFLRGADCWGWATWKRGWDLFETDGKKLLAQIKSENLEGQFNFNHSFNYVKMLKDQIAGKNSSWAVRWYASAFLKDKLTLYPGKSLVQNIGADGDGTHVKETKIYDVHLAVDKVEMTPIQIEHNYQVYKIFEKYFRQNLTNFLSHILMKIKSNL